MSTITFLPTNTSIDVEPKTKILVAAKAAKVDIRFGCAACRCGTCAVSVSDASAFMPMADDERALLARMNLSTVGDIRLSCRGRILEDRSATVDIGFQITYSPAGAEEP